MVQTVLSQMESEKKALLEYKILHNFAEVTTIIMKFADPDHSLFQDSDFNDRRPVQAKYKHRTPSQLHRDDYRLADLQNRWSRCSNVGLSRPSDSGLFSPTQGAASSSFMYGINSQNVLGSCRHSLPEQSNDILWKDQMSVDLEYNLRDQRGIPEDRKDFDPAPVNAETAVDNMEQKTNNLFLENAYVKPGRHEKTGSVMDFGVQCDITEIAMCGTEYTVEDFEIQCSLPEVITFDIGVQSGDAGQQGAPTARDSVGLQCGSSVWHQKEVGISCRRKMKTKSEGTQTHEIKGCHKSVSCTVVTRDSHVQTVSKGKLPGKRQVTTGCQTSSQSTSRHVDAVPQTANTCTQTKALSKEVFGDQTLESSQYVGQGAGQGAGHGVGCSAKMTNAEGAREFLDKVAARRTRQAEYASLINNRHRNHTVHHILHETRCFGSYTQYEKVWFIFDDLGICYNESDGRLHFSYYTKFYDEQWNALLHILREPDTYNIVSTDIQYDRYKDIAEREISKLVSEVREFHPG
jgi:hypothetical protein